MNTEERLRVVEEKLDRILALYAQENFADRMVLYRGLQLKDKNQLTVLDSGIDGINVGATTGKVGFYNTTPVVKAGGISNPSGGATVDSEARTAINTILTAIRNIGITA